MKVSFDDCFQTFPTIKSPNNLEDVWDRSLTELRKIPVDPKTRMILSRSLGRESLNEVSLAGFGGYRIRGLFAIPRRRGKVPAILAIGMQEVAGRSVSIRRLGDNRTETLPLETAIAQFAAEAVPPDLQGA